MYHFPWTQTIKIKYFWVVIKLLTYEMSELFAALIIITYVIITKQKTPISDPKTCARGAAS